MHFAVDRESPPTTLCLSLEKLIVLSQSLLTLHILSYVKLLVSRKISLPKDIKAFLKMYIYLQL